MHRTGPEGWVVSLDSKPAVRCPLVFSKGAYLFALRAFDGASLENRCSRIGVDAKPGPVRETKQ